MNVILRLCRLINGYFEVPSYWILCGYRGLLCMYSVVQMFNCNLGSRLFTQVIWLHKFFCCSITICSLYISYEKERIHLFSATTCYLTVELSAFEIPGFSFACTGFSVFLVFGILALSESASAASFSGCTPVCTVGFARWWTVLWWSRPLHSQIICLLF